jgi:hypothetical protein
LGFNWDLVTQLIGPPPAEDESAPEKGWKKKKKTD